MWRSVVQIDKLNLRGEFIVLTAIPPDAVGNSLKKSAFLSNFNKFVYACEPEHTFSEPIISLKECQAGKKILAALRRRSCFIRFFDISFED